MSLTGDLSRKDEPGRARRKGMSWLVLVAYSLLSAASCCVAAESQLLGSAAACAGAESRLRTAAQALDRGGLAEAERLLVPLQASHPDCGEVLLGLARLHASRKDAITAQQLFSQAIELAPQDARGHYYFAQFCFSQGEYRRADYYSDKALSLDGGNADALVLKGQLLAVKGQTPAAQELLEKACKLDPTHAEAHYQLGVLLDGRKLHREAVQQFEKVTALRPHDPRAYDFLALNLESLGEAKRAEVAYRKGLQVNKGLLFDSFLDYNYGRFLLKENRPAESKVHLDRALRFAPETRAVHYEHGKLNLRLQRYREARLDAERALSLPDPSGFVLDLQVYYLLATVYSRLGENELARKYTELCRTARIPIRARERK